VDPADANKVLDWAAESTNAREVSGLLGHHRSPCGNVRLLHLLQSPDEALQLPKAPFRTSSPVQTVLQHHDEPDLRRFKQATAERLSDRVNAHRVNEMNIGGFQVSEMGYSNERHDFVIQSYNKGT